MSSKKKVLIITYHWPPSGGIGVLRCLKFAKYLRDFGWEPIIFTAKDAPYQFIDTNNDRDIPHGLEIHKVPLFEPTQLFKQLSGRKKSQALQNITSNSTKKKNFFDSFAIWVRGNFFIPDARARWIKPSVRYLSRYLEINKVDAILTDGPPHTNTVIGMRLAQKFNIPWLADFQDPWTQVDYYAKMRIGKRADKRHHELEQEVFKAASKITIASPTWKHQLEEIGASNVGVIYYGYDEDDFSNFVPKTTDKCTIFHGGLLGVDRKPSSFLKALSELLKNHSELKSIVRLRLAGEVDFNVVEEIKKYNLEDNTDLLGMIPRKDVIKELEIASLLLLPINKSENAKGRVPGKLFELLRSHKPILVFGPDDGDVKTIVEKKRKGRSFQYENFDGIYHFLEQSLAFNNVDNFDSNESLIEFSNKEITGQIANYLNEITQS